MTILLTIIFTVLVIMVKTQYFQIVSLLKEVERSNRVINTLEDLIVTNCDLGTFINYFNNKHKN